MARGVARLFASRLGAFALALLAFIYARAAEPRLDSLATRAHAGTKADLLATTASGAPFVKPVGFFCHARWRSSP